MATIYKGQNILYIKLITQQGGLSRLKLSRRFPLGAKVTELPTYQVFFVSLNALSRRVSDIDPIAQWGVSLPRETTRKLLYKPPLTKFLLENGADPLQIQDFLWLNKTTAFKLEPGTLVKVVQAR